MISTSAVTGEGVEALRDKITGKVVALSGNSGVGKSSLLNRLCPSLQLPTGEVSEKLGRGRHTTRHIELFCLPGETYVADTPGFSSFDTDRMEHILKENLQYAFPDFAPFLGKCQFHDCAHRKEPGCAVTAALERGEIEPTRYESYCRLYDIASAHKPWKKSKNQTVEKPRRRLMRKSSGGCVRGAKSPPRVQSNRILKLFLKVSKSAQRGEKTFSTR